jgi:protein tyrosine/serine phosphatase
MNNQREKKILDWYHNEVIKDSAELESQKKKFIDNIKRTSKDIVFEELKPKKYTLWQRIKKVLMNI